MKHIFRVIIAMIMPFYASTQTRIIVHLDTSIHHSFTGRLMVFTTTDTVHGVPNQPDMASPQPMYAVNVKNWDAAKPIVIDDKAESYSLKPSELKPGSYSVAGIIDANTDERGAFNNGNCYSGRNAILHVSQQSSNVVDLYLDKIIQREFRENDSLKLVQLKSKLLSDFHHKDIFVKAGVLLPHDYDEKDNKTYPVVFVIPGWGGTHYDIQGTGPKNRYGMRKGREKIYVYLNPETQCKWGLHAFVDSRVNGPWGKALVEELIPYIRKRFKATPDPQKTFVMGQSSGGYPSLWLPLHYPKAFGGGWAVSPDPVDFSNFTGVDLYAPNANFYSYADGAPVPFFYHNGHFQTTMKQFMSIEFFNEDGGQQQAFEAEFGKLGKNGMPKPLFNRVTGAVDPDVVRDWEAYDLGRFIETNWSLLQPDLTGKKLHVYAGANDNFQLNKAVLAFKEKAEKVHADITAEIIPGADHFSIWSPEFSERVQQEMDALIDLAK